MERKSFKDIGSGIVDSQVTMSKLCYKPFENINVNFTWRYGVTDTLQFISQCFSFLHVHLNTLVILFQLLNICTNLNDSRLIWAGQGFVKSVPYLFRCCCTNNEMDMSIGRESK